MSMKTVVLGILMEGKSHPYEMQQFIKRRAMDKYIKIQKGSLYYTVEQLEKNGFIEIDSIIRDTSHPDKTVYRITDSGRREFHGLLLEQLKKHDDIFFPLHETIVFMKHLDKDELINALKQKIEKAEQKLLYLEETYKGFEANIPRFGLHIMASGIEFCIVEINLLKRVLADVENGSFTNREALDDFTFPCVKP